jgi:tetratricopeptide (TPR) repeat protein
MFLDVADEEAEAAFREGRSLAQQASDLAALGNILLLHSGALQARQRFAEALSTLDEAIQVSDRTGDRGLRAAVRTVALAPMAAGRLEELRVRSQEGLDLVGGDPDLGSEHAGFSPLATLNIILGDAVCYLGHLREGFETLDRGLELARQHDQIFSLSYGNIENAILAITAGDLDRLMRAVRELAVLAEKQPTPVTQMSYRLALARAHLAREEWEEAARTLEPLQTFFSTDALLARAYLGCGDQDRARTLAEQAVARNRASGALSYEIHALRTLAQVLRTIDPAREFETIETSLSRAEDLVRETGARLVLPSLHEERAALARALQRPSDADSELREAHRLYTEMGAAGHAERLARELGL